MELKIKKVIRDQIKVSYAQEGALSEEAFHVDCGDGINIVSISEKTRHAFENLDFNLVKGYPHSTGLKEQIVRNWSSCAKLTNHNIVLSEGSFGMICFVNRIFLGDGDKVLGLAPSFSEYESDVKMWGAQYDGVYLKPENNYRFCLQEVLDRIDDSYKLIYIDNPNNPTGQIIPLDQIRAVAQKAAQHNVALIVDEAYGEYMPKENSAVNLMDEFENVIVFRTFSKGYGLAGLRAGYGIVPDLVADCIGNITAPYNISALSRAIAQEVASDEQFLEDVREKTAQVKANFMGPWKNLSLSENGATVSIMLVTHKNPNLDLAQAFADHKIKVVSADSFSGIGKNSVRFRVPAAKDVPEVLAAFQAIDAME